MKLLKYWHPFTGILHLSLAFFTTTSMLTSLLPTTPSFLLTFTYIHGASGCFLFLTVLAHWIWNFSYNHGEMLHHLFPYRHVERALIKQDLRNILTFKVPPRGRLGGLSGLVEGLGLLTVTAMVLTGPFLFINILVHRGVLSPGFEIILDLHSFFAIFVWIYWFGHVGMALLTFYIERRQ